MRRRRRSRWSKRRLRRFAWLAVAAGVLLVIVGASAPDAYTTCPTSQNAQQHADQYGDVPGCDYGYFPAPTYRPPYISPDGITLLDSQDNRVTWGKDSSYLGLALSGAGVIALVAMIEPAGWFRRRRSVRRFIG